MVSKAELDAAHAAELAAKAAERETPEWAAGLKQQRQAAERRAATAAEASKPLARSKCEALHLTNAPEPVLHLLRTNPPSCFRISCMTPSIRRAPRDDRHQNNVEKFAIICKPPALEGSYKGCCKAIYLECSTSTGLANHPPQSGSLPVPD